MRQYRIRTKAMIKNIPITTVTDSGRSYICAGDMKIINFNLNIFDEVIRLRIGVTDSPVKLADIVPLARVISEKIVRITSEKNRREGINITCRKGCAGCCRSCLVPVSIPEVLRLQDEIFSRPQQQRSRMLQSCVSAARRILNQRPPELFLNQAAPDSPDSMAVLNELSRWYVSLRTACPFLSEGICTIYEQRPSACMEYFVANCSLDCGGNDGVAKQVEMPVRMVEVLGQLTSELEDRDIEAVMLPLALVWCELNPDRGKRTWPAAVMVERFVKIIRAVA